MRESTNGQFGRKFYKCGQIQRKVPRGQGGALETNELPVCPNKIHRQPKFANLFSAAVSRFKVRAILAQFGDWNCFRRYRKKHHGEDLKSQSEIALWLHLVETPVD